MKAPNFDLLNSIVDRAYYMALEMIDIANNRVVKEKGEPKVGGHPSACASSKHILGAIHLLLRKPEDYFACKPHVSPMDHAYNYLLHNMRLTDGTPLSAEEREQTMHHLRHFSKEGKPVFQSYHAESDPDSFRYFPSGSVGIPPVNALYLSLAYQFAKDHHYDLKEKPTFWCLMGDSEFREGSLAEAMPDAGERELKDLVWIVDYNRQNLDGTRVLNEKALGGSDADRIVKIAEANGWRALKLKHGKKREKLFAMPGGEEFQRVLDEELSDFEFQALLAANNPKQTREVLEQRSKKLAQFFKKLSTDQIQEAFLNLAGHDLETLFEAFSEHLANPVKPLLVVAYTIKGHGLRCQALSGNHSAMPESAELDEMAAKIGADPKNPFAEFPAKSKETVFLAERGKELVGGIESLLKEIKNRKETHLAAAREIDWPEEFNIAALKLSPMAHTQWMWGQMAAKLDRLGHAAPTENEGEVEKQWRKVAKYFLTMAPDVGSSTNTSPNMSGKLYGDVEQQDFEAKYGAKDKQAPDVMPKTSESTGHIRFEIAEGNCMSAAGSFGKFFHFVGIPFFPAMTIYDFFIKRAHDQLYYNLYWHSGFVTLGTPSGITLAPEGAQHSWKSDFQIPNCVTWEPTFAKELEWIFADMLKRHWTADNEGRESTLIRGITKGILQKEMLDRLKKQKRYAGSSDTEILIETRRDVLSGGYALIHYEGYEDYTPGDNVVHLFAMGALTVEAIKASDALLEKGIYANVFVVTSSDLLLGNFAESDGYQHLKRRLRISGNFYLPGSKIASQAAWLSLQGGRIPVVSIHDGEPGLLDNIGSIVGVKQKTLAVRKTSKSGTTWDIFEYHHLNSDGILEAVEAVLHDTAQEEIQVASSLIQSDLIPT